MVFCAARLLVVLTHSPRNMVALRSREVAEGHFFFLFGCAAHAANLVAQDAARQTFFDQALCASLFITVFLTRSSGAHALRAAVQVRTPDANVGTWRSCSRTPWAGHAATIRAVAANIPALRQALLKNSLSPEPASVPRGVAAAVPTSDVRGAVSKYAPGLCLMATPPPLPAAPPGPPPLPTACPPRSAIRVQSEAAAAADSPGRRGIVPRGGVTGTLA